MLIVNSCQQNYAQKISPLLLVTSNILSWIEDKRLSELNYFLLIYAWSTKLQSVEPSQAAIAHYLGVCVRTVIRYQHEYEGEGVIDITRRGYKKTNQYKIASFFYNPEAVKILKTFLGNFNFSKKARMLAKDIKEITSSAIVTLYYLDIHRTVFEREKRSYLGELSMGWDVDPPPKGTGDFKKPEFLDSIF